MSNMALKQVADYEAETEEDVKVELAPRNNEEKEQKAVCAVCEGSRHQDHKSALVEEAVAGPKERLKSDSKARRRNTAALS